MTTANHPSTPPAPHARPAQRKVAWALFLAWLAYSSAVLGWHLANDPLIATYQCRTRY